MPSAIVASSRPFLPDANSAATRLPGRRADDQVGREAVLLERLDHADVGEAARRAAAERQADARPARRRRAADGGAAAAARAGDGRGGCRRAAGARWRSRPGRGRRSGGQPGQPLAPGRRAGRRSFLMPHRDTGLTNLWFAPGVGAVESPVPSRSGWRAPIGFRFWGPRPPNSDDNGLRMYRYDEFDRHFVHQRAAQFRDQLERHLAGQLPDDDFRALRLQNGWYVQRHAPMARIAVPYGELSSKQLRALARIAREFDGRDGGPYEGRGGGFGHFTTRQNCQFNWIALPDAADVMDILADVDMHGIQTSGNCIRNITSDCFAGVAADEIVDPRPYCEILRQWSTLHPEFAFLPRKFKIAVSGASEDRAATAWHDIGLVLRKNDAGEIGFEVRVGGGMGRTPIIGTVVRDFLPWKEILVFIEAIVRVYNRYGRRDNLYKARIKILVKAEGQKFIDAVEAEFASILARDLDGSAHLLTDAERDRIAACFELPEGVAPIVESHDHARATASKPAAYTRWLERNVHAAPARRLPRRDALAQARRPAAGRRVGRPDGPRRRARRPLQRRASCASRTTRTWSCRGCARASCRRSGRRRAKPASRRPTSATSPT